MFRMRYRFCPDAGVVLSVSCLLPGGEMVTFPPF
jgi:hypothetical protein